MTRARDTLVVSYPLRYYFRRNPLDDVHSYGQPSRFLTPAAATFDTDQRRRGRGRRRPRGGGARRALAVNHQKSVQRRYSGCWSL